MLYPGLAGAGRVVVIAATNRPNALDPALRRPGRLDRELLVQPPDAAARLKILQVLTRQMPLAPAAVAALPAIAASCTGYVGADLAAIGREAALAVLADTIRMVETGGGVGPGDGGRHGEGARCEVGHLQAGIRKVRPASQRSAWVGEAPATAWDEIGGLDQIKRKLQRAVEWPLKYAETYEALGIDPVRGVLLHGNARSDPARLPAPSSSPHQLSSDLFILNTPLHPLGDSIISM